MPRPDQKTEPVDFCRLWLIILSISLAGAGK
jgi:hypothetical protein